MRCSSSSTDAHRHHYTCNQWLEETDCSLAIKARERKVTGGLKEKKKEQTFVPLVSSQRNRGDERTEGATLKKPRERADTKKNWGKGTEEKPKKKQ